MVRQRVRIRFCKQGDLRLLGHRDLARLLERLFRRAGLRLEMSEGFHPKPRVSFPSALALGIEGRDEVVELELAEPVDAESLLERLRAHAVDGLGFRGAELLPPGTKKAQVQSVTYEAAIPAARRAETADRAGRLWDSPRSVVPRGDGGPEVDVRAALAELTLVEGRLRMRLRASPQRSAGPRDVLAALGLADLLEQGFPVVRTAVELQPPAARGACPATLPAAQPMRTDDFAGREMES
jgi:radical SAM-linked protein